MRKHKLPPLEDCPVLESFYTDATFIGHVEWPIATEDALPPTLLLPSEVQEEFRALRKKLHDRIRKLAADVGVNIVKLSDVVTFEPDNACADSAVCTQEGAYLAITTYVVHDGQEEEEHEG